MLGWIFDSFWGWIGFTGVVVLGCVAVAWLFPSLRVPAAGVAAGALGIATVLARGRQLGARDKQAEWDAAERRMTERSNKARADAVREVETAKPGAFDDDEFDRDRPTTTGRKR
jgi:hypothetical protein